MQIALTGHKSGIGEAVYNHISNDINNWILIDRNAGDDIKNIDSVFDKIKDCDIFINNVYFENAQNILFDKWVEYNKDKSKICINVGSAVANTTQDMFLDEPYYKNKKELHRQTKEWNSNRENCVASLIVPAFCDTPFAGKDVYHSEKVLEELRTKFYILKEQKKLIQPVAVARVIKFVIDEWKLNNHIDRIEIRN